MRLTIEYCSACGYAPRAVGLSDELLAEFDTRLSELALIPSSGGVFEITLDDDLLYSKKETGSFPEHDEVLKLLRTRIGSGG